MKKKKEKPLTPDDASYGPWTIIIIFAAIIYGIVWLINNIDWPLLIIGFFVFIPWTVAALKG